MNAKPYDDLPEEVADNIAKAFREPQTAKVAKQMIVERLKERAASWELSRLSDEECRMLAEFRRFKATTKPGGVFKWQTRPEDNLVVDPPDVALISDSQEATEAQVRRFSEETDDRDCGDK